MNIKGVWSIVFTVWCSVSAAQTLDVEVFQATAETKKQTHVEIVLYGQEESKLGSTSYTKGQPVVSKQQATVVRVNSDAANINLLADTKDRLPVNVVKIGRNLFVVENKEKAWCLVQAVDFEKKIFEQKQLQIEPQSLPDDGDQKPMPAPPIGGVGLKVLIIAEQTTLSSLPEEQLQVFYGQEMRKYLNESCSKDSVTQLPEWRVLDPDTKFPEQCDLVWCKAMARERGELPWIIVSNGKTGFEGKLPKNTKSTIELINRFK